MPCTTELRTSWIATSRIACRYWLRHVFEPMGHQADLLAALRGDPLREGVEHACQVGRSRWGRRRLQFAAHGNGRRCVELGRGTQSVEPADQVLDRLQVPKQVVQTDHERQEVVAGQCRSLAKALQQVLECVRAPLEAAEAQGARLPLDLVDLAEHDIDLVAELRIALRRHLEHGIHHAQRGVAVRQELPRAGPARPAGCRAACPAGSTPSPASP